MAKAKKSKSKKNIRQNKKPLFVKIGIGLLILAFGAYMIVSNLFTGEQITEREYVFKKEGELVFTDSLGNSKIKIDIEIADNDYDRQLGLMFRTEMEEKQGMLFKFPREEFQSFWMRNTHISLDIIFINSKREIVTIQKSTRPVSDQSYPSSRPAQFVVEVIAGFTDKHNIVEGDKVNWMEARL